MHLSCNQGCFLLCVISGGEANPQSQLNYSTSQVMKGTPTRWGATTPSRPLCNTLCFSLSDVVEAHEARRHSWEDVLSGARLQDERATWHPVHHWTLHQLCHRHDTQLQRSCRALDQKRGRSTLPAQLVVSTLAYVWICFTLWRVIKKIGNRNRRRLSGLFFRMSQTCNTEKWHQ